MRRSDSISFGPLREKGEGIMKRDIPRDAGKEKRITTGRIIAVSICLTAAIATLTVGITLTRMVSTVGGRDSAQAAAFIVEAEGGAPSALKIDFDKVDLAGTGVASYAFAVTNTRNGKTAEISVKYDLIVTLPEALPNGVKMTIKGKAASVSADGKTHTFKDAGTFKAGQEETHNCVLTFSANSGYVTEDFMFEKIQVSVHAEQVD